MTNGGSVFSLFPRHFLRNCPANGHNSQKQTVYDHTSCIDSMRFNRLPCSQGSRKDSYTFILCFQPEVSNIRWVTVMPGIISLYNSTYHGIDVAIASADVYMHVYIHVCIMYVSIYECMCVCRHARCSGHPSVRTTFSCNIRTTNKTTFKQALNKIFGFQPYDKLSRSLFLFSHTINSAAPCFFSAMR